MHDILNPTSFMRISRVLGPVMGLAALALIAAGMYLGLFASPADYQQGEAVRIMYVHVPCAWMSLLIYSMMALMSASYLIWRNPLFDTLAQAAAPIGAVFTFLTLVTGSLWGKPIWGTWWAWDARMTSVLILFFLYIGYIALGNAFDHAERAARSCAILCLVGAVNIPIIKFSVQWWNTLHQPASIVKSTGPSIDPSMMTPLLTMFLGFLCYFLALLLMRTKTRLLGRKIARAQMRALSPHL